MEDSVWAFVSFQCELSLFYRIGLKKGYTVDECLAVTAGRFRVQVSRACVELACFPCTCTGFLPSTVQTHAWLCCLETPNYLWEKDRCVCVYLLLWTGELFRTLDWLMDDWVGYFQQETTNIYLRKEDWIYSPSSWQRYHQLLTGWSSADCPSSCLTSSRKTPRKRHIGLLRGEIKLKPL